MKHFGQNNVSSVTLPYETFQNGPNDSALDFSSTSPVLLPLLKAFLKAGAELIEASCRQTPLQPEHIRELDSGSTWWRGGAVEAGGWESCQQDSLLLLGGGKKKKELE